MMMAWMWRWYRAARYRAGYRKAVGLRWWERGPLWRAWIDWRIRTLTRRIRKLQAEELAGRLRAR